MISCVMPSRWLQVHFLRLGPARTDLIEERVCSLTSAPIDIFAPSTPSYHKHLERGSSVELELIGLTHFVVYNSHCCFEMVGQKKGVLPWLSSIPRIWVRERSLPFDAVMVYYIRALWSSLDRHDDSDGTSAAPLTCCLLREDAHWRWYSKLLPKPEEWVEATGVLRRKRKKTIR